MLLPLVLIYLLFKVFPPIPWPQAPENSTELPRVAMTFFGGWVRLESTWEERLLLLVIVSGALGSYIHAATSFADYVGNKKFRMSWRWWYWLRPFIGIALALVLYFVARGGFLLLVSGGQPSADDINPFGIGALAGLVGMFSKQATDKLDEVFSTLFKAAPGRGDDKRGDSLSGAPTPQTLAPDSGPSAGGQSVVITGTGFAEGAKVFFGEQASTSVTVTSATSINAVTPAHATGGVDVSVENPDGQKDTLQDGYTYLPGGAGGGEEEDEGAAVGGAAPTVSKVDPDFGSPAGGEEVTITGANFVSGAAVAFGAKPATSVTFVDHQTLRAVTPDAAEGAVAVTVTNPGGRAGTLPSAFTYSAGG